MATQSRTGDRLIDRRTVLQVGAALATAGPALLRRTPAAAQPHPRGASPVPIIATVATGHHWDGRWRTGSRAPASRDSDSQHEDRSVLRCPPCEGDGESGASAQVAPEAVLGEAPLLAHTGHSGACG
jgi:hypothetical protein